MSKHKRNYDNHIGQGSPPCAIDCPACKDEEIARLKAELGATKEAVRKAILDKQYLVTVGQGHVAIVYAVDIEALDLSKVGGKK